MMPAWFTLDGQGWLQLAELALAFVLAAAVGLEREYRQKSAGLRTYSLVGVSAALFMLISKYGFMNVLANGRVVVDPSRVAAQVVSGIGFIGGGVIFMRRNVVRGLTTAASVWLTAALGMACGSGLPLLGIATTLGYFLIMFAYPRLVRRFLPREQPAALRVQVEYQDSGAMLSTILITCRELRFVIGHVQVERVRAPHAELEDAPHANQATHSETALPPCGAALLTMDVSGSGAASDLIARLCDLAGVVRAGSADIEDTIE